MAPQFELQDPYGLQPFVPSETSANPYFMDAYTLGPGEFRMGPQYGSYDASYARSFAGNDGMPNFFDFAGEPRIEGINDYRNPRTFRNPYQHLQRASDVAFAQGPHAAQRMYEDAIAMADAIPQDQVRRDMESNRRDLQRLDRDLQDAMSMGVPPEYLRNMFEYRRDLVRDQHRLYMMKMAPAITRANAGLCFLSSGDDQLMARGQQLIDEAQAAWPQMASNYFYNMRLQEAQRLAAQRRGRRQAPPVVQDPPGTQQGPRGPEQPPKQPGEPPREEPPKEEPPKEEPPKEEPPKEEPPKEEPPKEEPPKEEPPKEEPPKEEPPKEEPAQPPAKFDAKVLAPSGGVYNPAGPPGLGESAAGEQFSDEKEGGDGWDIDWRSIAGNVITEPDGSTTYNYEGEIDDGVASDTNFTASETWKDGVLLKSSMKYDGSLTFKVKTDGEPKEIEDVVEVTTVRNAQTGNLETDITTSDGTKFRSVVDSTGKVLSFKEVQTKMNDEAVGVQAKVENFAPSGDTYHPLRPLGLGGYNPGYAGGDDGTVDWRTAQVVTNGNGTTTYKYEGELEDGSVLGDTNFTAEETLDADNNLLSTLVKYDGGKDVKLIGKGGQIIEIEDCVEIKAERQADGNFKVTAIDDDDNPAIFYVKPDGTVYEVLKR